MNNQLSQFILAEVMQWSETEDLVYRPHFQTMATYKYDDYQQYFPGMRFIESLALWLNQFKSKDERKIAIDFIKDRLVYISNREINRIVYTLYEDYIKSILINKVAQNTNQPNYLVTRITNSTDFKVLRRQCLFLGFSDGAKTEIFRRANPELSHEQIYQSYELSAERAHKMQEELIEDLRKILGREPNHNEAKFRVIFLMDDFTASGKSYIREEEGTNKVKGKVVNIYKQLTGDSLNIIDKEGFEINLMFYLCTKQASDHISNLINKIPECNIQIHPIYQFSDDIKVSDEDEIHKLCSDDDYYDKDILEDTHTKKGGSNVKFGFGNCQLPIILNHNTPNNSLSLLWAYLESDKFVGLFPRIARHKD